MKKIAIIGANEFQNPLILKAKDLGYETHVFAWQTGDIGEFTADHFYPISIVEKDAILEKCQEVGVDAIVSIASDLAVLTVNYVSRAMGFPCNSEKVDNCSTNKFEMRRAFLEAGIPVPKFLEAGENFTIERVAGFKYPLIVKPTDRSGSRGVTKVESAKELLPAIENARGLSFKKQAIVEEFIYGNEYSCECVSYEGKHHMLAVTKKYTTEAPHFIETGHREPSDIPEKNMPMIRDAIYKALDALHIKYGASHPEFRINEDGEIRIIEIGARMGGDCIGSDLVQISTGFDFIRMVIDIACGHEPVFTRIRTPKTGEVRFIFDAADLIELERVKKEEPETIWRIGSIREIIPGTITDSSTRFGYYILAKKAYGV